jgi:hypothetical protein
MLHVATDWKSSSSLLLLLRAQCHYLPTTWLAHAKPAPIPISRCKQDASFFSLTNAYTVHACPFGIVSNSPFSTSACSHDLLFRFRPRQPAAKVQPRLRPSAITRIGSAKFPSRAPLHAKHHCAMTWMPVCVCLTGHGETGTLVRPAARFARPYILSSNQRHTQAHSLRAIYRFIYTGNTRPITDSQHSTARIASSFLLRPAMSVTSEAIGL